MQLRQPLNLRKPLQMTAHKIRPTLNLPFAASGSLGPLITYTGQNGTYFNSSGTLTAATTNVARFDYNPSTLIARGLLIEEARTNSIRNNTMVGAGPGLPSSGWFTFTALTGLTTTASASTENGISYLSFRLQGTPSGAGTYFIGFEANNTIAALTGQTWTNSTYLSMPSGSMTGVTSLSLGVDEYSAVPALVKTNLSSALTAPTSAALRGQRQAYTVTFSGGGTVAFALPYLRYDLSGAAIDITLRIGMPQLELGAFATSVISTSSAAVTRTADIASITGASFSSFWNATQGTIVVRSAVEALSASNNGVFAIGDPTKAFGAAEVMYDVYATGASNQQTVVVITGGAVQASITPAYVPTAAAFSTLSVGYAANNLAASTGGSAVVTDTSVALPTPTGMSLGSLTQGWSGGATYLNGWISSLSYYPVRLTNTQLQTLST